MNKIIYITFFFFLFAIESKAESNMMFEKANQLYHNKMYDSASVLYSQLINDSYLSPNLFYNAGNSFYRTEKIGLAIGTISFGLIETFTDIRTSVLALVVFFIAGIILLLRVPIK